MLEDKTAFITGGGRGIGLGIAKACLARGAKVAIADIDPVALEAAAAELGADAQIMTIQLDVTDREGFAAAADDVEEQLGPVSLLFNNAGIMDSVTPVAMRGETWDFSVNVNLNGVYNGLQAFVPRMIERKSGWIANTSSMAGLIAAGSGFSYHATKFAVVGLSRSLRYELAHHNINVSVICPGMVATSIVENTKKLRPGDAERHSTKITAILSGAHERLLSHGESKEDAGERIVSGLLENRPYLFTDASDKDWRPLLEQMHEELLSCLPSAEPALAAAQGA